MYRKEGITNKCEKEICMYHVTITPKFGQVRRVEKPRKTQKIEKGAREDESNKSDKNNI
jgi:hypothetical protein